MNTTTIETPTGTDEASVRDSHRDIYCESNYGTKPYSVYFYYHKPADREAGTEEINRAYFHDHHEEICDLDPILSELAHNAANDLDSPPKIDPTSKWRRKSYLVVLVDSESLRLERCNALEVKSGVTGEYCPNYSFLDATDKDVEITGDGPARNVSAVALINHMMGDDDGKDLDEGEKYNYDIVLNYGNTEVGFRRHDSGGTNLGGSVPPPAR